MKFDETYGMLEAGKKTDKVEKRAEKEHRTVTNMVEAILREATEK